MDLARTIFAIVSRRNLELRFYRKKLQSEIIRLRFLHPDHDYIP